ncbi:hypothetical protein F7725_022314, partial [Dissostichus mawsoni]
MREYRLYSRQRYTDATDQELDQAVQRIQIEMPTAGYRMVKGRLLSMGMHVQWRRVTASLHRVDPGLAGFNCIVRRTYSVRGPLSLWHVDTNHKLIRVRGDQGVENVDIAGELIKEASCQEKASTIVVERI